VEHVVLLKAMVQTCTLQTENTYHELLNIDLFHWTAFFFFKRAKSLNNNLQQFQKATSTAVSKRIWQHQMIQLKNNKETKRKQRFKAQQ